MNDDLRTFRELILWLWQTHEKPWEYHNEKAQMIVEMLNATNNSLYKENELEVFLPSHDNVDASFPSNRYFYLSPVLEGQIMVPRIQLNCDFGRNIPEIRCRLELFLITDDAEVKSLGYRFEAPEGIGIHHYYHIQIIQTLPSMIDWLPETQPAFPLDADDPVKLILGLLISLYGFDYLGTIKKDANNVWGLDEYIDHIPHTSFGPFEWYRLIEIGNPVKYALGYKITSDLNTFDNHIRGIYPGCRIKGITRYSFDNLKEAEKHTYP